MANFLREMWDSKWIFMMRLDLRLEQMQTLKKRGKQYEVSQDMEEN